MAKIRAIGAMMKSAFVKGLVQWRFLAAVLILFLTLENFAASYARAMEIFDVSRIHWLEPALRLLSNGVSPIVLISILVWLSDAPFFDQNEVYVVNRVGRWWWMGARLAYAILGSGLFLLLETALITLRGLPLAGAAKLSEIFWNGDVPLKPVPVGWIFGVSFLLNWLSTSLYVLLMFAVNMRTPGTGLAVSLIYWGFDQLVDFLVIRNGRQMIFSPFSLRSILNLSTKYVPSPGAVTLTEAFAVLIGVNVVLIAAILLLTPGYPFPFVKRRQGRTTD